MADNVTFQSEELATPPKDFIVATDEVDGVDYQKIKIVTGEDGVANDLTISDSLPVVDFKLGSVMLEVLEALKRIEQHLSILTNEEIR